VSVFIYFLAFLIAFCSITPPFCPRGRGCVADPGSGSFFLSLDPG
jgi:hypothetical protein